MTEPKSECCGADVKTVYDAVFYKNITETVTAWHYECSKCHKPCTVRKEEKDG